MKSNSIFNMSSNTQFVNPPPTISLPNMSIPPPIASNLSAPPPTLTMINTSINYQPRYPNYRDLNRGFFKPFRPYHAPKLVSGNQEVLQDEFDGKRLRKSVMRKTVDYNSAIIKTLENRIWQRDFRDRTALQPDVIYYPDLLPPPSYIDNPINAVTTRFVKTATNKIRCPIFCMAWTPEGRRVVTGASSGEFTLWNGLTYNFETILQAHDSPVRAMVWSHNESWMVTGDHAGYVKYWQSNMNNVKMFQAHKEAIRGLSFSPTDHKLATCSDDGTVRIWDFYAVTRSAFLEVMELMLNVCTGIHKKFDCFWKQGQSATGKIVGCKSGQSLATFHAHKSTVMDIKWNENGNWIVTASRDHLLKLFDLRNLNQEVQTFRGHKKEASSVAWHPSHEGLFCSGGSDGAILFWHVGADKEVGAIEQAHDSIVWTLAWHPLGHILCSGSNDHTSKFWTRNRPGDLMRDKYNLNTLPAGVGGIDDHEVADEAAIIPGMGPEDRINTDNELEEKNSEIPGLDLEHSIDDSKKLASKKIPYSKPIPRNFQAQWNEMEAEDLEQVEALNTIVNQLIENTPGAIPLIDVSPNAIILYGKMIPVEAGSKLAEAISKGTDAINKLVQSGEIEELRDVIRSNEDQEELEDYLQDDGEVDYFKIPDVDLPAPLASSKFAQNPEFLKTLNRGGKHKFEQLIGWNDGGINDKTSKVYEPVVSGSFAEDSQSSDTDIRYGITEKLVCKDNFNDLYDEDYTRNSIGDSRIIKAVELDYRYGTSVGPGRPISKQGESNSRNNYGAADFRQKKNLFSNTESFEEEDIDENSYWDEQNVSIRKIDENSYWDEQNVSIRKIDENSYWDEQNVSIRKIDENSYWDEQNVSIRKIDENSYWDEQNVSIRKIDENFSQNNFDKYDGSGEALFKGNHPLHTSNNHNTQNMNQNLLSTGISTHLNLSQKINKSSPHPSLDSSITHIMPHHNIPPFRPNCPPPQVPNTFNTTGLRLSPNSNYPPNKHLRQVGHFPNQNSFNNFAGPPSNFRPINPSFDRSGFGRSNFKGQSPSLQSAGTLNNYNPTFGNYQGKNRPNHNSRIHGREAHVRGPRGRKGY